MIPKEVFEQHLVALGKTGSGKSYTLRILIEILLKEKKRVCIIDPKGDHWGIKSSADGRKPGYPVVIFGGDHADVPLNPKIGKEVAELIATGNRPCVIDFRGWMPGDRTHFWIDFSSTLFRLNRSPLWLVIDEVHNFAPQGKVLDPEAGKSLHWTNRLASEGRGLGIKLFMASQRPQKVHKDTLTCAETLIAMRVIHYLDRMATKDWIDGIGDNEKGKLVLNSLAQMKRGEAFVWSPEIHFFEKILFPKIETFDSFQAPSDINQGPLPLTGWANVDLEEIKNKLTKTIEEAKENDPKFLKIKIAELEKQIKNHSTIKADNQLKNEIKELQQKNDSIYRAFDEYEKTIKNKLGKIARAISTVGDILGKEYLEYDSNKISINIVDVGRNKPDKKDEYRIKATNEALNYSKEKSEINIGKGERIVLIAIAQHPDGVDREQITILTGYKRSSRDAYIQRLIQKEYCMIEYFSNNIYVTKKGISFLGNDYQPLPTGDELREYWLNKLPAGEKICFEKIVDYFPDSISRDKLSEMTDYKRSSRDAYLQRLAQRKLIKILPGSAVIASEKLFQ